MSHTTLDGPSFLQQPNVSSAQVERSRSQQSVAVSDDYYSLSDHAGDDRVVPDSPRRTYPEFQHLQDPTHLTPQRNPFNDPLSSQTHIFSTPPEYLHSPEDHAHEHEHAADSVVTPTKHAQHHASSYSQRVSQPHVHGISPPRDPLREHPVDPSLAHHFRRKPVSSDGTESTCASPSHAETHFVGLESKLEDEMDPTLRTGTPGVDDSPYIRFAIDQLTRDEDVRGSRRYPSLFPNDREESSGDENGPMLPRIGSRPVSNVPRPLSNVARPVATVEGANAHRRSYAARDDSIQQARDNHRNSRRDSRRESYREDMIEAEPRRSFVATEKEMRAGPPPRHPLEHSMAGPGRRVASNSSFLQYDVFVPFDPPSSSAETPRLTYLPRILTPLWMGLFTFLCILMLVGLIVSAAWSKGHDGLWDYHTFGDNRYFTFEYLPTLFGMILLLWLMQIEIAVQRIAPFIALASNSTRSRSEAAFLDLFPTQFIYPKLQYFGARQWVLGSCLVTFWLFIFTIPLLAASFNARYFGDYPAGGWRWVATQGVIWTVVTLYILLIIALITLAVYLRRNRTGLKWDPRSMADLIALLERANIMSDYVDSETFAGKGQFRQRLRTRTDRLGYWHTSRRPQEIFYGLGEEGGATRRYSLEQGRIREKQVYAQSHNSSTSNLEHPAVAADVEHGNATRLDLRNHSTLRRHTPWTMSATALLAFMLVAIILLVAFLVVSFVHSASTAGFFPKLQAPSDANGFSPANFLYSFLPALLGLILFLAWQPIDFTLRRMAPYSALARPHGSSAEQSILLDYPFLPPFLCTLKALRNRDWLVVLSSATTLLAFPIPILAGGVFWAQFYPDTSIKVSAEPAGWYALCLFLALYAFGFVVLFVSGVLSRGRGIVPALPHETTCLAEILSWLYMSPLLTDSTFVRASSKAALVRRLQAPDTQRPAGLGEKPRLPAVPEIAATNPPRLTVRLLEDGNDNYSAPHNRLPDDYAGSHYNPEDPFVSRPSVSSIDGPAEGHITRPLTPLSDPSGPARFAFGIYMGRDGREHLGIDRFVRSGREMVVHGTQASKGSWMWR
ncbi:hypothetical protein BT63DRAFT_435852 [Microthyrium microscopicum]|uniref:Phosphoribosylaminoimidazole-succinocarboxamide synthase n=1 Tax=Microthyrium microscopicum TaxID=703497 RepID=A0A6A6USS4_9PEZI|nr:hypothetical protein BT63DRAFT_435852 [Microthyrium microscopicum]